MNFLLYQELELLLAFTLKTCVLDVLLYNLPPVTFYNLVLWFCKLLFHVNFWKIIDCFLFVFLVVNSKFSIFWRLSHHFLSELQKLIKCINIFHFGQFLFAEFFFDWIHSLIALRFLTHWNLLLRTTKRFLRHFNISQEGLKIIPFDGLYFLLDNFLNKDEFLCFWDIQKVLFIVFFKAKQG